MSYRFYADLGDEYVLLEQAGVVLSPLKSGVGAISLDLPESDPKYPALFEEFRRCPVKIETWRDGEQDERLSFYLEYLGRVTVDENGDTIQQFTGRFIAAILADAAIVAVPNGVDPYIPSGVQSPGAYMVGIFDYLKGLGAFANVTRTFDADTDSNGVPWVNNSKTEFSIDTTVLEAADQLASSGQWEWTVTDSDGQFSFHGYNPGSAGRDLSETVVFHRGRDVQGSARQYGYDKLGTTLIVYAGVGNDASQILTCERTDAAALARWRGRKRIITETRTDIKDAATLDAYTEAKLPHVTQMQPQVEIRGVKLTSELPTPIPFDLFTIGDYIGLRVEGELERYSVDQITLTIAPGGTAVSYDLVVGIHFRDPRIPPPPVVTAPPNPYKPPANPPPPDTNEPDGPGDRVWATNEQGYSDWRTLANFERLGLEDYLTVGAKVPVAGEPAIADGSRDHVVITPHSVAIYPAGQRALLDGIVFQTKNLSSGSGDTRGIFASAFRAMFAAVEADGVSAESVHAGTFSSGYDSWNGGHGAASGDGLTDTQINVTMTSESPEPGGVDLIDFLEDLKGSLGDLDGRLGGLENTPEPSRFQLYPSEGYYTQDAGGSVLYDVDLTKLVLQLLIWTQRLQLYFVGQGMAPFQLQVRDIPLDLSATPTTNNVPPTSDEPPPDPYDPDGPGGTFE